MIRLILFFLLIAHHSILHAQTDNVNMQQKLEALLAEKKYGEAIPILDFIVDHQKMDAPDYASYRTRYALWLFALDSIERAKKRLNEVIYDPFINDRALDKWFGEGEVQGNYKNMSCELLGFIYFQEKKFDLSTEYFEMAIDSFPYYHIDTTFVKKKQLNQHIQLADAYSKSGNLNKAFEHLFPYFENGKDPENRTQYKAVNALAENGELGEFQSLMSKDFHAILDKEIIVLKLGTQTIVIADYTGQNKTLIELEQKAKYYWNLFQKSVILSEAKKFMAPKVSKQTYPSPAKPKPRPKPAPTPPPLDYPGRK
jgi:tetratricopeptide (TPR) repeat protein